MAQLRMVALLTSLAIFPMQGNANTLIGDWGTFRGKDVLVAAASRINHLFTEWGFQVSGKARSLDWEGRLINRPEAALLVGDDLDDAPNVVIHICGGGLTTITGCKASLGHFRNSGADILAAYAPSQEWGPKLRRHHVHKAARQILSDIAQIIKRHPNARFSFSSASLGYPVFAALFGEKSKYSKQLRELMTREGAPRNSRIDVIGLTTPARGWYAAPFLSYPWDGGIGVTEGPEELYLTGVLSPKVLLTLHDGEQKKYHAPEVYSEGAAIYAFPFAISLLDPDRPEKKQGISYAHRDVHRAGVEWTIPTLVTGFLRHPDKGGAYHADQALQIGLGNVAQEATKLGLTSANYDWYEIKDSVSRRRGQTKRLTIPELRDLPDNSAVPSVSGVAFDASSRIGARADLSGFATQIRDAADTIERSDQ